MPPEATSPCDSPDRPAAAAVRARVLLPLPLVGPYDYAVPTGSSVVPGDFVVVPLGRNSFAGVVWDGVADQAVPDAKLRALEAVTLPGAGPPAQPDWRHPGPVLSPDQQQAAAVLVAEVERARFGVTLLEGVTGAGKTEVYFEAIAAALARQRQVLVLLPEIALSVQWLERFARRFGVRPAVWHSELTGTQRRATWRQIAAGTVSVVVGARSALFLPLPKLGLVVGDGEHDGP